MSFYGASFIFNNIPSEMYDLRIFSFNPSNPEESPSSGAASIKEEWLYRREAPYFYGRYYEESFEFDFTVGSYNYIDGATRTAIQSWLIGKSTYIPLRIVQDDISDVFFNVILTRSNNQYIGNINYALTLHAQCDRPWGIYYPPTLVKNNSAGGYVEETFDYVNLSAFSGYNKPIISFTMAGDSSSLNDFSIINNTDNGREFKFTDINGEETITVDNDRGIISTTSPGVFRISNFNKKFFRLLQGVNSLTLKGAYTQFVLDTIFAKGIGA